MDLKTLPGLISLIQAFPNRISYCSSGFTIVHNLLYSILLYNFKSTVKTVIPLQLPQSIVSLFLCIGTQYHLHSLFLWYFSFLPVQVKYLLKLSFPFYFQNRQGACGFVSFFHSYIALFLYCDFRLCYSFFPMSCHILIFI